MSTLPFVRGSETSEAAAKSMKKRAKIGLEIVKECLEVYGQQTDEQMQERTGLNPSTQRPRRIDLVNKGLVEDSGEKALTKSGREATLWRIVKK